MRFLFWQVWPTTHDSTWYARIILTFLIPWQCSDLHEWGWSGWFAPNYGSRAYGLDGIRLRSRPQSL